MVAYYMQLVAHPQILCVAALPLSDDGFNSEIILMCSFYSLCATFLHISLRLCNQEAYYVYIEQHIKLTVLPPPPVFYYVLILRIMFCYYVLCAVITYYVHINNT